MYKNQLQELAQRSCFNLPSYRCIREGPDHAPRFKSVVNFNGENFESPSFCNTLRQAEHSAAEIALYTLATRGPSRSLAAKILDETGVYKNLLQETAYRAGLDLPVYSTIKSGLGHVPVFTSKVELGGISFTGEPARNKKQAQKNAAISAWSTLKQMGCSGLSSSSAPSSSSSPSLDSEGNEEQEDVIVGRVLARLCHPKAKRKTKAKNLSTQSDRDCDQIRSVPVHRNTDCSSVGLSAPPNQYPWPFPNFSHEVIMYQIWQHEQALNHLRGFIAIPIPVQVRPSPPIFPLFMQSDFGPYFQAPLGVLPRGPQTMQDHFSVLPGGVTLSAPRPSICFPNCSVPSPIGSSQVTIQEIPEERNHEVIWVQRDTNLDNVNVGATFEVHNSQHGLNPPQPLINSELQVVQTNLSPEFSFPNSAQPDRNPWELTDMAHGDRSSSLGSVELGFASPLCPGNPIPNPRQNYVPTESNQPPVLPAPPLMFGDVVSRLSGTLVQRSETQNPLTPVTGTLRNTTQTCSPGTRQRNTGVNFMVPAINIRSINPVYSAAPASKLPEHNEFKPSSSGNIISEEKEATILDLNKLKIMG